MSVLTADVSNPSQRIVNLVCSFSQDIVYAVTCGNSKPPKQVLLSYGVKTLTGNAELLQILNRFGHGSYHQLEENDTALCIEKIASNLNQIPIIPKAIQANLFTNLTRDNIDRLEETLTGEGTTHCVNGIIVQPQVYGPHLPTAVAPVIEKQKQRTITQEVQPINPYISGGRVGPQSQLEMRKTKVNLGSRRTFFGCFHEIPTVSSRRYRDGLVSTSKHVMMRR